MSPRLMQRLIGVQVLAYLWCSCGVLSIAQTSYSYVDWTAIVPGGPPIPLSNGQTVTPNSTVMGTIPLPGGVSVGVTYTGEIHSLTSATGAGSPYWTGLSGGGTTPLTTYTGALVANGPTGTDIITTVGGASSGVHSLSFSRPIVDLAMPVLSLGTPADAARFTFDHDFVIDSVGPGYWGNGSLSQPAVGVLEGKEGHGTIVFPGPLTTLTWTAPTDEIWQGFTVGLNSVVNSLSVSGLSNFDIVSPPDLDVNDFHIKLQGVSPHQIADVYPPGPGFGLPNNWYPHSILPMGSDTVVTWDGDFLPFVGQTLHFGIYLTPDGIDDLEGICMNWTVNGQPVFSGGDPTLPIAITPAHPVPGEPLVQIVNQICPDIDPGPPRWIGPVEAGILNRHAALSELVAENPILEDTHPIIDSHTLLEPGDVLDLPFIFDGMTPLGDGDSYLVWYDSFEDEGGMPGRYIGTSYNAFNISAASDPSIPGDFNGDGDVDGDDFLRWQRGESPSPLSGSDLADWKANFGTTAALGADGAVVPEPTSFGLGVIGLFTVVTRMARRRRRKLLKTGGVDV